MWDTVVAPELNDYIELFNPPAECKDFELNPNSHPVVRSGRRVKSKIAEESSHDGQTGQNDSSAFHQSFEGDSVLNYMHVTYLDRYKLLKLVCEELDGGVGTESASILPQAGALTGALISDPASRRPSTTLAAVAKRHQRERTSMSSDMPASSATLEEASRRWLPSSVISDLAQALASAKVAGSLDMIIEALEKHKLECINECCVEIATAKRARLATDLNAQSGTADNGW